MAYTLGVIGCGKMAYAIISGLKKNTALTINQLLFNDVNEDNVQQFALEFGGIKAEPESLIRHSDIIILAIKPNQIKSVIEQNQEFFNTRQLIISVAAGISTNLIERVLRTECAVIRTMPNTPAMIGEGVTAISAGKYATNDDIRVAESLFTSIGKTFVVNEKNMDAITAISGSGPAYVYLIIEALINAGIAIGLDSNFTKNLVIETFKGSINMMEKSGKHPAELREAVSSPAGTTIAALKTFEEKGLRDAIYSGVEKAFVRAQELGQK